MLEDQHSRGRARAMAHPVLMDPATGLANGLHFDLVYSYLFSAGERGLAFAVALVSVGGAEGVPAELLPALGQKLQAMTRTSDLVAHMGGGRFSLLLLGTNVQGARVVADRLEVALAEICGAPLAFGLTQYDRRMRDSSELLEAADRALRAAEAAGGGAEVA